MQYTRAIFLTVACPTVRHFSTLPHKRHDFRKTLLKVDHLGGRGVDGRIIVRWIFRRWDVGIWAGSSWLRIGTVGGHLWMR